MTTHSYSSPINNSSDAGFRAWGSALSGAFGACLVQTADTGQINWLTVTVPLTINTSAGYEIFRFDDAKQSTAPVFVRVEYGTFAAVGRPRVLVTVGTGTNGAGVITGVVGSATSINYNLGAASTVTAYLTRACSVDGAFGLLWGLGGAGVGAGFGFLGIGRSVDSNGDPTADAVQIYSGATSAGTLSACQIIRYAFSDVVSMVVGSQSLVVGGATSSAVGADFQVYKHYMNIPRVRPHPWFLTVINTEIPNNTQFMQTAVGITSRNYISSGTAGFYGAGVSLPAAANYSIAMIYE